MYLNELHVCDYISLLDLYSSCFEHKIVNIVIVTVHLRSDVLSWRHPQNRQQQPPENCVFVSIDLLSFQLNQITGSHVSWENTVGQLIKLFGETNQNVRTLSKGRSPQGYPWCIHIRSPSWGEE